MIPAGLANALFCYAQDNSARIAELVAERDALVTAFLSGGKASVTINSASLNGKTFAGLVSLSSDEKLTLLTEVLTMLGEATPLPTITVANFLGAQR